MTTTVSSSFPPTTQVRNAFRLALLLLAAGVVTLTRSVSAGEDIFNGRSPFTLNNAFILLAVLGALGAPRTQVKPGPTKTGNGQK